MKMRAVSWSSELVNIPGIDWNKYETETAFQTHCADWLRKQYELTGSDMYRWWHHSANERVGARAGLVAKMMGQSRGFPDFIHIGSRLAIEFKVRGTASNAQDAWLDYFESIGWHAEVIYRAERFKELTMERARVYGIV